MTITLTRLLAAALLTTPALSGCGSQASVPAQSGHVQPVTPQALAWVASQHLGDPSSARAASDGFEEFGEGTVATEMRYGADGEYDGDLLGVTVATALPAALLNCDSAENESLSGCVRTDGGLLLWRTETPEEDPGNVGVIVEKPGGAHALVVYAGPPITGDPRDLDLPVSVEDMVSLAHDPLVDIETTGEAVETGKSLEFWRP